MADPEQGGSLDAPDFYSGQRLSYDEALCTVRYVGPLKGTKGTWLGVEWDDSQRGKHDGRYQGEVLFKCLSTSPTAASFIKSTRKADFRRTFLNALRFKYTESSDQSRSTIDTSRRGEVLPIEISGKVAEEVGFDRIRDQQSLLENLKIVVLDELRICGLLQGQVSTRILVDAQEEVLAICPHILELDIGWNLMETWQGVADICYPLVSLRVLRASGLRFRNTALKHSAVRVSPFVQLQELFLDECLLTGQQVDELLRSFASETPRLKTLSLSSNNLGAFPPTDAVVHSVKTLLLENNILADLRSLPHVFKCFPDLDMLSMKGNIIQDHSLRPESIQFPTLKILNLSRNHINGYSFIDMLPSIFPNISSLQVSQNPVVQSASYGDQKQVSTEPHTSFYLILARIPNLESLNYTKITSRDREEGEIFYLSAAEKDLKTTLSPSTSIKDITPTFNHKYPRYPELCTKYDRPSIIDQLSSDTRVVDTNPESDTVYPPGSVGARSVQATIHLAQRDPSTSSSPLSRFLPRTINVYTLKGLVARHFHLPALQFRLIYESPELDPVKEEIGDPTDWEHWGDWDVDGLGDGNGEVEGGPGVGLEGQWVNGILYREGRRWRRRETEIVNGWREWGYYLEDGVREVMVRVEPFV